MTYEDAITAMYEKSKQNMAKFGKQSFQILIVAMTEELGELAQAYLQAEFDGKPKTRIYEEAIDLGALCLQFDVDSLGILEEVKYGDDQPISKYPTIELLRLLSVLASQQYVSNENVGTELLAEILSTCAIIVETTQTQKEK